MLALHDTFLIKVEFLFYLILEIFCFKTVTFVHNNYVVNCGLRVLENLKKKNEKILLKKASKQII